MFMEIRVNVLIDMEFCYYSYLTNLIEIYGINGGSCGM